MKVVRKFVAYYHFTGWDHWSCGLHLCPSEPNIEVHLPFGFFRVGWVKTYPDAVVFNPWAGTLKTFGFGTRH